MRQLLIWCATRALEEKPSSSHSEDRSAALAGICFSRYMTELGHTNVVTARVIQDELLKEFSSNSELSNWFSREDVEPPTVVVKKPNPRNVQNIEKIKELEAQIQKYASHGLLSGGFTDWLGRLQKEGHALNALLKQPAIPSLKSTELNLPKSQRHPEKPSDCHIDTSLLEPSQQSILALLKPTPAPAQSQSGEPAASFTSHPPMTPSTVSSRLSRITAGLAPTLDAFASGIHNIELYRNTADAVSSQILRICAQRLEERDALNTQQRVAIEGDDDDRRPSNEGAHRPREDLGVILGALSRVERR